MDIQILGQSTLKIKTRKTTLGLDPQPSVQKFDADAIIAISKNFEAGRVNNYRVVINAAGEYEVGGLKISGISSEGDTVFSLISENVSALIARASSLEKFSAEKLGDYEIIILNADSDLKQSLITAMEPNVVVLYGAKAKEGAKTLGKESASTSAKISLSEDKLPEEMDVMVLG